MDIVNALKRIKKRAIEKGLTYDLDSEWFENKLKVGKCEMTGLPFNTELPHNENPFFPSIDRTDNNSRIVSWMYNCGKSTYTDDVLYIICKAVIDNNVS